MELLIGATYTIAVHRRVLRLKRLIPRRTSAADCCDGSVRGEEVRGAQWTDFESLRLLFQPEIDFDLCRYGHRGAFLHGRLEAPLLNGQDRLLVQTRLETA
jgi:hypothetical protein